MSEQFNALCDYSSSSEEDNDTEIKTSTEPSSKVQEINNCDDDYIPSPAKRICKEKDKSTSLPSVPSTIRNMYKNTENILNGAPTVNSYQHDQRVRTFPHTRGNWATSIFIKVTFVILLITRDHINIEAIVNNLTICTFNCF